MFNKRFLMWTLWPSFLVAGLANGFLFTLLNPLELTVFGHPFRGDPMQAYTVGFFMLWCFMALSSGLSLAIQPDFFKRLEQEKKINLTDG